MSTARDDDEAVALAVVLELLNEHLVEPATSRDTRWRFSGRWFQPPRR
ncbi:MAG: hypothetical protein KGR42_05965 [Acidobacteria bacterium]|nr:hypothetical protein [Acidobacteriota bacterium]